MIESINKLIEKEEDIIEIGVHKRMSLLLQP